MTDNQKLKKAGWVKTKINDKWWWIDPVTQRKYRVSHAIMVLEENLHQEEIKTARLEEEAREQEAREAANWDIYEHPIEDLLEELERKNAKQSRLGPVQKHKAKRKANRRTSPGRRERLPHGDLPKVGQTTDRGKEKARTKDPSGGRARKNSRTKT